MSWLGTLQIACFSQGLLLCLLLLSLKTGNRRANYLLAFYVALDALGILLQFLAHSGASLHASIALVYLLVIFKGPAIYLYIRALVEPDFRLQRSDSWHALVLLPALVFIVPIILGITPGHEQHTQGQFLVEGRFVPWVSILIGIISIAYASRSLWLLKRHRRQLEDTFSLIESISLAWLYWLLVYFIAVRFSSIAMDIADIVQPGSETTHLTKAYIILALNMGVIYIISIGGLRQPLIFTHDLKAVLARQQESSPVADQQTESDKGKYARSGLSADREKLIFDQLRTCMSQEKLYLSNELNLPELAERMGYSAQELSQVINNQAGIRFYEFINGYRVDEARQLLAEPANDGRKMLDIAMEAGFNSESTFYSQFKKHAGQTPRQYRQSVSEAS